MTVIQFSFVGCLLIFQWSRANYVPRSHGREEPLNVDVVVHHMDPPVIPKQLPEGVKIAEQDGMIILYGVLYNNNSNSVVDPKENGANEVNNLSSKIASIIKKGAVKENDMKKSNTYVSYLDDREFTQNQNVNDDLKSEEVPLADSIPERYAKEADVQESNAYQSYLNIDMGQTMSTLENDRQLPIASPEMKDKNFAPSEHVMNVLVRKHIPEKDYVDTKYQSREIEPNPLNNQVHSGIPYNDVTNTSPKQSNDIIVGRPKYSVMPQGPPSEITVSNYQNVPRLDEHLFNLSTSYSFTEPPVDPSVQEERLLKALTPKIQTYSSDDPLFSDEESDEPNQVEGFEYPVMNEVKSTLNSLDYDRIEYNTGPPDTNAIESKPETQIVEKETNMPTFGSNNPLYAEPITFAIPGRKDENSDHKNLLRQVSKPSLTVIYPESTVKSGYQLIPRSEKQQNPARPMKDVRSRRVDVIQEEILTNEIVTDINEETEEPYLETEKWQIYWDPFYKTYYYFNKFSEISTWNRPAELEGIKLGLQRVNDGATATQEVGNKVEKEPVPFTADEFFNPIPPPSIYKTVRGLNSDDKIAFSFLSFFCK